MGTDANTFSAVDTALGNNRCLTVANSYRLGGASFYTVHTSETFLLIKANRMKTVSMIYSLLSDNYLLYIF